MSTIREAEWDEIKRLYIKAFRQALRDAHKSHKALGAPEAMRLEIHPAYGFVVAVAIGFQGTTERPREVDFPPDQIDEPPSSNTDPTVGEDQGASGLSR